MRSITFLNSLGHLIITWEENKDDEVSKMIQQKMDQGIRFFAIRPFNKKEVEIKTLNDISGREIQVKRRRCRAFVYQWSNCNC